MFDFGKSGSGQDWYPVVDGVMGGLSTGKIELTESSLLFTGSISLANNGGFSSIRTPYQPFDFSNFSEVELRYRCKGQTFALVLETSRTWWKPKYKHKLPVTDEGWNHATLSLEEFGQYAVGKYQGRSIDPSLLGDIIRLGIITDSKQEGSFEFELDYIKFK